MEQESTQAQVAGAGPGTVAATAEGAAPSARDLAVLRTASFGALAALVAQFVLGSAYAMYGTRPKPGHSLGMFGNAFLAVHVVVGAALIVFALVVAARAIQAEHRVVAISSGVALLALVGAFVGGSSFLKAGAHGASLGMAVGTAVGLLCYGVNLWALAGERRDG